MNKIDQIKQDIYITKPLLPDLSKLQNLLQGIWQRENVTNCGPIHNLLEKEIIKLFGNNYISLVNNGMTGLCIALKALELQGEVITTPFTFAATPHALSWNNLTPVFCDIDPITLNIDSSKIEDLITEKTSAILATHVYGNPCDVEKIKQISDKYNLKIIYDAAHAFSLYINGTHISHYGDISVFSFHATKLFNTIEGGAVVTSEELLNIKVNLLRNFGINKLDLEIYCEGINGKLSELHCAVGLLNLNILEEEKIKRNKIRNLYVDLLSGLTGITIVPTPSNVSKNSLQYFPIRINKELYGYNRDYVFELLKKVNIYSRKYFYPLCSHFPHYKDLKSAQKNLLPVAEQVASEILCLPFYGDLSHDTVEYICSIIRNKTNS